MEDILPVYLPIANLSVNGFLIVLLGAVTGVLSGLFGVGGGFLTTPLLIFYGIPPTVAAASASTQVTGASVSGVLAHSRRSGVDYRMGAVTVGGGIFGAIIGAVLFRLLQAVGQIDIGNAATEMAQGVTVGVPQANGEIETEPLMDVDHVADAVIHMARLPLETNILFLTVMATRMPFVGRG